MPNNSHAELAESHAGLNLTGVLRDCLDSAVITLDSRRKITSFNHRAEQLTRFKAAKVLDKSIDFLPAPVRKIITRAFTTRKPVENRRINWRDAKGSSVAVQVTALPARGKNGKVSSIVLVMNDVSSASHWDAHFRRLERLHNVGALSASMAHEVKNAFVAVKTFVDLLLEQNKDADLAEVVRFEMSRIDSILGQMRRFSGPAKPAFASTPVHTVVDKSLQLIHHLLESKKIQVTRSFAAAPDVIEADQDQLEQVFINLFFNAIDAMNLNGRLVVSTETVPPGAKIPGLPPHKNHPLLRVTIQNDGPTIPPEHMDHLFEPFFTTKPEGTGLGLAISQRIIKEHGGVINALSETSKGTSFSLILPARGNRA